jgi:hypothetical protein
LNLLSGVAIGIGQREERVGILPDLEYAGGYGIHRRDIRSWVWLCQGEAGDKEKSAEKDAGIDIH